MKAKKVYAVKRPKRIVSEGINAEWQPEIDDLCKKFITHPNFQHLVKISASQAVGSTELGWRRGHQAGIHDSYKSLKRVYPKAADALLEAYRMNKDGGI